MISGAKILSIEIIAMKIKSQGAIYPLSGLHTLVYCIASHRTRDDISAF
jgi:hypothetical protein